jgi:rieske iron-sulfur protein
MAEFPRICRRELLTAGLFLGAASLLPAQDNPAATPPREGDLLVKAGDAGATPLAPADIRAGGKQTMAWAMDPGDKTVRSASRLNRILLVRLDPARLSPVTQSHAAEGVVAFSAICTHSGCEVTDFVPQEQRLFCPCHESTFDPLDGAKVIDGPATRVLPALPLKLVDGKLVVAKTFTAPITFETQ